MPRFRHLFTSNEPITIEEVPDDTSSRMISVRNKAGTETFFVNNDGTTSIATGGASGVPKSWGWLYSNDTVLTHAGPGDFLANSTNSASITQFALGHGCFNGTGDPSTIFIRWAGVAGFTLNGTPKAWILATQADNPLNWIYWMLTGISDDGNRTTFTVTYVDDQIGGTVPNLKTFVFNFVPLSHA